MSQVISSIYKWRDWAWCFPVPHSAGWLSNKVIVIYFCLVRQLRSWFFNGVQINQKWSNLPRFGQNLHQDGFLFYTKGLDIQTSYSICVCSICSRTLSSNETSYRHLICKTSNESCSDLNDSWEPPKIAPPKTHLSIPPRNCFNDLYLFLNLLNSPIIQIRWIPCEDKTRK